MNRPTSKALGRLIRKRIPFIALALVVLWSANDFLRSRDARVDDLRPTLAELQP